MSDVDFEAHTTYFARVAKEAKIARLQIHDELSQRLQQAVAPKPKPPDPKAPPGLPGPPPTLPIPPGFESAYRKAPEGALNEQKSRRQAPS
jgi:hypothetical protein